MNVRDEISLFLYGDRYKGLSNPRKFNVDRLELIVLKAQRDTAQKCFRGVQFTIDEIDKQIKELKDGET